MQHDWCPPKKGKFQYRHTHTRGECHVQVKAGIRVMFPHTKDTQVASKRPEARERSGTDSPSRPFKRPALSLPWSRTSSLQIWETIPFCRVSHSIGGPFRSISPSELIHPLKSFLGLVAGWWPLNLLAGQEMQTWLHCVHLEEFVFT